MATKATTGKTVTISPPKFHTAQIHIQGISPFVQLKFSQKTIDGIREKQEQGSTARSKRTREARDFNDDFVNAQHRSTEGWAGIPASAFRQAAIDVCRMTGAKMTFAKMSVFVNADGFDATEGTPLVRIIGGEPEPNVSHVRNATGVVDLRARAMWREWGAVVSVTFDADQFTIDDVVNLFSRAGVQVGVGEGRPFSKNSSGMGWGMFQVTDVKSV
jgi:hypothetical protein